MSILEPDTIDPQRSGGLWDYIVLMVFEPLLNYDPHTLRPVPAAALDLPALASDGLRYTFTLREGLAYSDGTRVLAKDFVYGWSRLCDPVVASTRSALVSVIVGCDSWRQRPTMPSGMKNTTSSSTMPTYSEDWVLCWLSRSVR